MKQNLIYASILILSFLMACGKSNVDTSPPSVTVLEYQPQPVEDEICGTLAPVVFNITGGEEFEFDVVFEDDQGLSQYKVDIHNNFDCHGHGGGSAPKISVPNVENQTTDWTVLEVQNISGTSAPVERTLRVPENVTAGNYHVQIQVIDESGNDDPFANFHAFKILNPLDTIPPVITVSEPTETSLTFKKGATIKFSGQVEDNRSLSDGGNGVLYLAYTDLSSGNTFTTNEVFAFDETVDKIFTYNFEYVIPQTLVSGSYRFSLGANDGVRNVAAFKFIDVEID